MNKMNVTEHQVIVIMSVRALRALSNQTILTQVKFPLTFLI